MIILLTVLPLFFIVSTFRVTQFNFEDISADELETVVIQSAPEELKKIKRVDNRNSDEIDPFWSFYILDGRLISTDGTFNWRLNIWQDQNDYQRELDKNFLDMVTMYCCLFLIYKLTAKIFGTLGMINKIDMFTTIL